MTGKRFELGNVGKVINDIATLRLNADSHWRSDGERSLQQGPILWPRLEPAEVPARLQNEAPPAPSVDVTTKERSVTDQPTNPNPPAPVTAPVAAPVPAAVPADNRISIDEFMKIDLRVAKVTAAERVPNSKKLVKLSIDLGTEQRTVVAGIAEAYEADALVGRHVAIVANLKPAKLMGIESNGMVLAASPEGGKPMLVTFDEPPAPGTRVR